MPQKNVEFGKYGARGIKGSDAVARRLDYLVDFIATPVTARRGLLARLNYLTRSPRTLQTARQLGLTVTDRTLNAWLAGTQRPTKANLNRIETVYRRVRHHVARHLLTHLNSGGGTRVEIHPLNQSRVARPHQRVVEYRKLNVRRWDAIVTAWANNDPLALEEARTTDALRPDLGSQWGQYEYVSNIGFAA